MFDWNLYVPDFVRGFFVICVQIFEAYAVRTLIKSGRSWRKISHKGRCMETLRSNITQPAGLTKWAALPAQPNLLFYKVHNRLHNASTSSFVVAQLAKTDHRMGIIIFLPETKFNLFFQTGHKSVIYNTEYLVGR